MADPTSPNPFQSHPSGGVWLPDQQSWVPGDHPLAKTTGGVSYGGGTAPAAPGPAGASGPITTAAGVTGTTAPAGGSIAPGSPTTVAGAFQQALVSRMAPQPLTGANPQIAPAIQANRISEQRGVERDRNTLAERAAAGGTSQSGGFDTALTGLNQARSEREGRYEGDLIRGLGQQQSGEATSAMGLAAGLLGGEAQRDLQRYGIDTDARLREAGISLGQQDLGLRRDLGQGQLSLGLLGQQIGDQQFGQGLSAQLGMFGASQYQDALLRMLGGL